MNLKKVEALFERAWTQASVGNLVPTVVDISVTGSEWGADLVISFDAPITPELAALVDMTGCKVTEYRGTSITVQAPTEWVSAPTRRMFVLTDKDALRNALIDAGVSDWIAIDSAADGTLRVEFIDLPAPAQIDALKVGYELIIQEGERGEIYLLSPRTTDVPLGIQTPFPDPAKVEARMRVAWGSARAGKIAKVEATDNPRQWIVTTVKPIPLNAKLGNHGLTQLELYEPTRARVGINQALWDKLMTVVSAASNPLEEVIADRRVVEATAEVYTAPPAVDPLESARAEIADLKRQLALRDESISVLQTAIRDLAPVKTEYMTVVSPISFGGIGQIKHGELTKVESEGWIPVHYQDVTEGGKAYLLTLMKKSPPRSNGIPRYQSFAVSNSNGNLNSNALIKAFDTEIEDEIEAAETLRPRSVGVESR